MKRLLTPVILSVLCLNLALAQDYTITTAGNAIVITDIASASEAIAVSENGTNINFNVGGGKTYSLDGVGATAFPVDIPLAGVTSITINAGAGSDAVNIGAFTAALPSLTVNGGPGDDAINFNGSITFANNANLDVDLQNDATPAGTDSIRLTSGSLILAGTGAADLKASRNIVFSASTVLRTVNGNLTLEANQQATATAANFVGINLNAANVLVESTGSGIVSISGKGGNAAHRHGISISAGSIIRGGTIGTMTLVGRGGASSNNTTIGVFMTGVGSTISSNGANVDITGHGGGNGATISNAGVRIEGSAVITSGGNATVKVTGTGGPSNGNNNYGVFVSSPAQISSGGNGTVTVDGTGGLSSGSLNYGVHMNGTSSIITSGGGNVTVIGTGGAGSGSSQENRGVNVQGGGRITSGGGTVSVTGTGGGSTSTGGINIGVIVNGSIATPSFITSGGGNVSVIGQGGGSGSTNNNSGIRVQGGTITAGGSGTVTVTGTGGVTSGNGNPGISIDAGGTITSNSGNVSVTGTGGGTGPSGNNHGISFVLNSGATGTITAGGTGTVTVNGTGGTTFGNNNIGVSLSGNGSLITSGGGNVSVTGLGKGNGASGSGYGIALDGGGRIMAGGSGTVTVNGTGSNTTGNNNRGIHIAGNNGAGTNSSILSSGGNVSVTGQGGGTGSSMQNFGVHLESTGVITAGGTGSVTVNGTGGNTTGNNNNGVNVNSFSGTPYITSAGGNVSVTGQGGGNGSSAMSYGVVVQQNGTISATGSGTVSVTGIGGAGTGSGILNGTPYNGSNHGVYVTQGSALITSTGGNITVTGTRGAGTTSVDIQLDNNGTVTSIGTFGDITFNSTSAGTYPLTTGIDAATSNTRTFSFGNNSKLNVDIDGMNPNQSNNGYPQLNIGGQVNLNNVTLTFDGSSYSPSIGNTFTIVNNDGSDAITGTFNGLAEGDTIDFFLGSASGAKISYAGGSGNDAVLTIVAIPITLTWTGAVSTDWFVAGNWSPSFAYPSSSTDVIIANVSSGSNRYPTIDDTQTAEAEDLTINAGAKLTFVTVGGGNMPEFALHGDFENNGTANVGDAQIQFVKPGTQTLNGPLETGGMIMIQPGTHLVTNGNLTLASGGQIIHGQNLAAGLGGPYQFGTVSNHPITVKRTGNPGSQTWNYWGSPVVGANVNLLGNRPHYYDALSATDPNTTRGLQAGWKTASGIMAPGVGYVTQGGGTRSFTGTVDFWNTDPTLTVPVAKGVVPYNMLGNPFPSAMDAATFMATNGPSGNGSLTGDIWFWDDDGTGGSGYSKTDFAVWNGTGSAGPNSGRIPSGNIATGQGFVVEAVTNGANVVFSNAQRSIFNDQFFRLAPVERLWVNVTNTQGLYNEVLIGFLDVATDGYDMGYDARKMRGNDHLALYTKAQAENYMIQALPKLTGNRVVELGLDAGLTGTYTFGLKQIENLDETVMVLLEDRVAGTFQNLRVNPNYEFAVSAAGTIDGRFFLHFSAPLEVESAAESCDGADGVITLNQSGSQVWNYTLADANGNVVDVQHAFNGTMSHTGLQQGEYTLSLSDSFGYQLAKTITVDGKQKVTAAFVPSSDAVTNGEAITFTNNSAGATTYEWDFGDGSPVSTNENPEHRYSIAGTYTVTLFSSNDDCAHNFAYAINVLKVVTTGINAVGENNVHIFAFENTLNVKFDFEKEEKAELTVYDVLGQQVLSRQVTTNGNHVIQLQHTAASNYFVQVRTNDKVYTSKVLVRR